MAIKKVKTTTSKKGNLVHLFGGKIGASPSVGAILEYRTPKAKAKKKFVATLKRKFTSREQAMKFITKQSSKLVK